MVKTIRYTIGKSKDELKNKLAKIEEFDKMVSKELKTNFLINIQTIVNGDDDEIMIATIGNSNEVRAPTSIGSGIIIILLLILIFIVLSLRI